MQGILSALILTLIAGSATGIGGALVLFKKKISSNFLAGALGLSAGVMIFISLAEMFPQAQAEIMASGSIVHGKAYVLIAFFVGMGIITLIDFLIPEYEIGEKAEKELSDKDQLILVYCRSGRRSKIASQALADLGYTNVKEFGGIIDWQYEIVK